MAAYDMHTQHQCAARRNAWLLVLFIAALCPRLYAQAPELFPSSQTRQPGTGLFGGSQSSQYRVCTPEEYGDPDAECIPAREQSAYSSYGDDTLVDNGIPAQNAPRTPSNAGDPSVTRTDRQPSAFRSSPPVFKEKEPPTDFQRYVATSTGRMLPIFGAKLFEKVPATFAPLDRAAVGPDYRIAPGDELQITIWGQFNLSRRVIVDRSGEVSLPDAGPVSVAGLNYVQASDLLKQQLLRLYKNFDVSISFGRLRTIPIFVVGEARRPGTYTVSSLSSLVNAIFSSGGPSARGSMRNIQLKRDDTVVRTFDLYDLLLFGDKSKDTQLEPGDVILIPAAGPRVAITGSVEHPAIYELKRGSTLEEVVHLADGPTPLAALKRVRIERVNDGAALQVLNISMNSEGLQQALRNGDIIRITPIIPRFDNAVTLKGNVADAGRFEWKDGMRLSDLIPDKAALLTRDYWEAHNALVAPSNSDADEMDSDADQSSPKSNGRPSPAHPALPPTAASQTIPISFREQDRNTRGDSSFGAATELDNTPPLRTFNPSNSVQPIAPEIDWQYAVIERLDKNTLETRKIPFNLGKLVLAHDITQNHLLEPGDVVTIFSKADFAVARSQQVKEVRLEGEVAMAGVYTVLPGEGLRQLVERAGGLTSNAYLYGAQFTREATRREQQKRYQDFLDQYEREANEAAANLSSRVTSPQQAATAQASITSQRDLIDRLRKVSMNGRIVLNIEPNARGQSALPDLPLENGDRLYIPSRPSTVNVMGNVFEQSSFLYQEDFRTGDYLNKAGGPARDADRSHMFVIRADGSVVSKALTGTLFAKSFDSLHMFPGDTVVVPTALNRGTFLRSLTDWSQVFSNFALGAAAVNVLH